MTTNRGLPDLTNWLWDNIGSLGCVDLFIKESRHHNSWFVQSFFKKEERPRL